jgi:hypothetical protein
MKIILFWSTYDKSVDTDYDIWRNKKINISPFHLISLTSHLKVNHNVELYTYQKFNNNQVPKGITIKDADPIFNSRQAFVSLKYGHSIAHISDAVRLKVACKNLGVVLDMDAVVLKQFPEISSFFSSMPAKLTGGMAPKWSDSHPPLYIRDKSWNGKALAAFPIKVNNTLKPYVNKLADKIIKTLKAEPKKNSKAWNYVLWDIKKIMNVDENTKVYQSIYFCPLSAWLPKGKCYSLESPTRLNGKTELFGFTLPSIKEIFERSYIVQHFFESSAHSQGGYGVTTDVKYKNDLKFWENIQADSLLGQEAEFVLGSNWKEIIYERIKLNKI